MAGPEIVVADVWHRYPGQNGYSLRGASIRLQPGSITGITGPNGSGKTTLLLLAALLEKPLQGNMLINGKNPWRTGEAPRLRGAIAYHPPHPIILRGSVERNIMLGPRLRRLPQPKERALQAARELGIESLLAKNARGLSRGQQMLVSIARLLAAGPRALLLDEPTSSLDPSARERLAIALRRLVHEEGATVVVVSHDLLFLRGSADRLAYMDGGRIIAEGDPEKVVGDLLSRGKRVGGPAPH